MYLEQKEKIEDLLRTRISSNMSLAFELMRSQNWSLSEFINSWAPYPNKMYSLDEQHDSRGSMYYIPGEPLILIISSNYQYLYNNALPWMPEQKEPNFELLECWSFKI